MKDSEVSASSKESASKKFTPALDFKENTIEDLSGAPDEQGLIGLIESDVKDILASIGVPNITDAKVGNFKEDSGIYFIGTLAETENNTSLLINFMYISLTATPSWEINSVADYYTGNYYYVDPALAETVDIYDYTTGKLASKKTKEGNDLFDQYNAKVKEAEKKLDELLK